MQIGTRLGFYEVIAKIGEGGMGEVYRARDTKLGRDVALKVLPDLFAGDPERLARFEREARTLASLNHPHIAHLHGLEDSSGTPALVMELVEGEDLAARIKRGPIPVEEALAIARQIAQALEAAHEHGVVHRDLKPANIKLRDDGTVKVLDFGLAKALSSDAGTDSDAASHGVANSPTITTPAMTMRGMILGTAAYMAPEQAKGKSVDKRADIWAFGCVLYEMVTGRRAFAGDDVSDTLASVLRAEVDWTPVPLRIARLLRKCLEKDPRKRLHDIGDAWDLVADTDEAGSAPRGRALWLGWGVAAVLAATTMSLAWIHFRETVPVPEVVRFHIAPPAKNTFDIYLSLSPDGRRLAFTARDEAGVIRLWVRDLDSMDARVLPGTEGAWSPFWSPDGRHLAFGVERTLKRIDVTGGPPQTVCESSAIVGSGMWTPDNVIVFGTRTSGVGLQRVAAAGGTVTTLTRLDGSGLHSFPALLDERRFVYFRTATAPDAQGFYFGSLDAGPEQQPATRWLAASLGPIHIDIGPAGGRVLYVKDATLVAQAFDRRTLQLIGDATPIADQIGSTGSFAFFSASHSGTLAYRTGAAGFTNLQQLTWLDRKGQAVGTLGEARPYSITLGGALAIAPGGDRAAVVVAPQLAQSDLWLVEFARGISTRFTFRPVPDVSPVWSPDGRHIVFRHQAAGSGDLYVKDANGTSDETPLLVDTLPKTPTDWSRDRQFILFTTAVAATGQDLWVVRADDAKQSAPLLQTSFAEFAGRFSPDGRWVAYTSNESGRNEVYLRPFMTSATEKPSVGAKWQVSSGGGSLPLWAPNGKEIFYRGPSGAMMATDVAIEGDAVKTSIPRQLFPLSVGVTSIEIARDGQRFLAMMPVAPNSSSHPIAVVLNWASALKP